MIRSAAGEGFERGASAVTSFPALQKDINTSHNRTDLFVIAGILALGALAVFSHDRAGNFLYDDVYYADCARSLLERGFYGIADRPETTQPPGVSAILALLCLAGGCTRAVFLDSMAVFEMLGFLVCYEFLRRQVPRAAAGAICLLLMSSALHFSLATQWISTCFPFLFATMGALLAARKLDEAAGLARQIAWACCLSLLLAAALMFGATALALIGSIALWVGLSTFRDRGLGFARCKKFAAVLVVAAVVQGIWMSRQPFDEWPRVPGFPGPYLQQLLLKNGHNPELGKATLRDIPTRIAWKEFEQSTQFAEVLFRRWIDPFWGSVLLSGPWILIALGWGYTVWRNGGGLAEWYFAGAEVILLLWPWRLDPRSFLPLAPLACLYAWRGALGLGHLAKHKARALGAMWLPVGAVLAVASWNAMHGPQVSGLPGNAGLQIKGSLAVWLLSEILAARMIWKNFRWAEPFTPVANWIAHWCATLRIRPETVAKVLAAIVVAALIGIGVKEQWDMRMANLDLTSAQHRQPADLEAALWVREHTQTDAVVMARQVPITYHYSGRKMVWFPPSSNAQILVEGIRKYKVNYVVLIRRKQSYFLPPEEECFANVLAANASAFQLVAETSAYRIYETEPAPEHSM